MQPAKLPSNEQERLAALRKYEILDTLPEAAFDEVTRLASQICDTPIALISLVDKDRQWFKSRVGLDAPETHRDLAFCAHAILEPNQALIVEDALKDERFFDSPLVEGDPKIRFYAGYPLQTITGEGLGTLCVIDRKAKKLSPEQEEALRVLANQVMIQLELRYALKIADETAKQREGLIVKLTESNMELDRFAYVASHDMQEPLRMITNFGDLLKTEYTDKIGAEGQEYIGLITDSAGRMQDMVRDLLENARLGSASAKLESVNANNALENALEHLSVMIKETDASITHDDLPEIKANKLQFMRLLQNLVGNGLKYQKEGIKPQVHVGVKDTGDFFEFSVLDNGIGIAPEHLEFIFKPFTRLHTWEEYQGTGMGLAVCKKIVENHGGKFSVTSEPDKGTTFYFTLPKTNKEVL